MRSSIVAVAIGSSAEAGSSSSRTSGSIAIARAMQSRCCWPPERPRALSLEPVLDLVPERGAAQRRLDALVELADFDPEIARRPGDVVVDRLREGVGLLEDHADPPPHLDPVDARRRRDPGRGREPGRPSLNPGIESFIRLRQRMNVDLPQPEGPISGGHEVARERRLTPASAWSRRRGRTRRAASKTARAAVSSRRATVRQNAATPAESRPGRSARDDAGVAGVA